MTNADSAVTFYLPYFLSHKLFNIDYFLKYPTLPTIMCLYILLTLSWHTGVWGAQTRFNRRKNIFSWNLISIVKLNSFSTKIFFF